jgi:hypothetical protein
LNPERVRCAITLSGFERSSLLITQGCRSCSNLGLTLANAFGVIFLI